MINPVNVGILCEEDLERFRALSVKNFVEIPFGSVVYSTIFGPVVLRKLLDEAETSDLLFETISRRDPVNSCPSSISGITSKKLLFHLLDFPDVRLVASLEALGIDPTKKSRHMVFKRMIDLERIAMLVKVEELEVLSGNRSR